MEDTQAIDWAAEEEEETEQSGESLGYSLEPVGRLRVFGSTYGPEKGQGALGTEGLTWVFVMEGIRRNTFQGGKKIVLVEMEKARALHSLRVICTLVAQCEEIQCCLKMGCGSDCTAMYT